jgi:hypothetical protein
VKCICALALLFGATAVSSATAQQQPTFPLLQDGGARSAFVGGAYETCLKAQRAVPENASLSAPELGSFCLCFGRALADAITGAEYETLALGKFSDSVREKQTRATTICISLMTPSAQSSPNDKMKMATEKRCVKEFHPEQTDYAAAELRGAFCRCYSVAMTPPGQARPSPNTAVEYCSQRLGFTP